MLGQTPEIAPADRKLYALRDVTGTVESIPLISASIMSKKLAEGLNGLVLDVKTGSGAFIPDPARALELARTMIALGETRGCPTVALLTAMDRPLGRACGHSLEVEEALEGLQGSGPEDLMEVTYALGARDAAAGRRRGRPGRRARAAGVRGQLGPGAGDLRPDDRGAGRQPLGGGRSRDPAAGRRGGGLPRAPQRRRAPGRAAADRARGILELGGGRLTIEDTIDPSVGFVITVKPGDPVRAGDPIASVFARDDAGIARGLAALGEAIAIGEEGRLDAAHHPPGHRRAASSLWRDGRVSLIGGPVSVVLLASCWSSPWCSG